MAFTTQEKSAIRYHLGYLETEPASSLTYGQPRPIETLFLVDSALERVATTFGEDRIRRIVSTLESIECKLTEACDRLAATRLEGLELRLGEPDLLEKEYYRWAGRLADILGVPLYYYSERFRSVRGTSGSIPVVQ